MTAAVPDDQAGPTLGFACHWTAQPERTWSGTPWQLRRALADECEVIDVGVTLRPMTVKALKALGARRRERHWSSQWRYGRLTQALAARGVDRRVRRSRPDVVLQMQDVARLDVPYLVMQDLSYSLLLRHFGDDGVPHFRTLSRRRLRELRHRQEEVYASAAALLPMSRWMADQLVEDGVDPSRIHVVPPGANIPSSRDDLPVRRRGAVVRLLFLGRDFDTKAGAQVVAAFALLRREQGHRIELTIAGPARWPLRHPPQDGVRFLGAVPPDEVGGLFDSHDLFVMPSHFEGFGIVFVEALARGLPCIGRAACAMPEIIRPGVGGALIDSDDPQTLADTIDLALRNDPLYEACAEDARQVRAHYRWTRAAHDVIDVARRVR